MKTIGQQINWDFEIYGFLEIRNKNHKPIYYENPDGEWYKWRYDSNGNEIYFETSNEYWKRREYDSENNLTYSENSVGDWERWEYDSKGNEIYYENSNGFWTKREWDSKGNQIYFDGSNGKIIDNRPKPCEDKIVESEDGIKCMVKINKNIMKTIGQQIKWDFDRNDNLEIRDKNDNPIYFENRNGDWYKWRYDSNGNEIYHETFNGDWTKREYDSKNNLIYFNDSEGQWAEWEYDSQGKVIYYENSYGFWLKRECDSQGNEIYFEDSRGTIKDKRQKNEITIDVSGIEKSGKSRVIFLLKQLLKEQKFNVEFDGGRDFDDESHFDEYIEKRFDDILENIKPITKIVIKESHTKPSKK